jgi:predicted RNA-binding protein YlqC (UPF0109 family)
MFDDEETSGGAVPGDSDPADDAPAEDEVRYADEYDDDELAFADGEDEPEDDGLRSVNGLTVSPKDSLSQLVQFIAANLVDDPEGVEVAAEQRGQTVAITLRVPEEELGKVIGRQGRIARAIRTVLTIAGSRQNIRASLDIEG